MTYGVAYIPYCDLFSFLSKSRNADRRNCALREYLHLLIFLHCHLSCRWCHYCRCCQHCLLTRNPRRKTKGQFSLQFVVGLCNLPFVCGFFAMMNHGDDVDDDNTRWFLLLIQHEYFDAVDDDESNNFMLSRSNTFSNRKWYFTIWLFCNPQEFENLVKHRDSNS